jgi:hypothetical protein
VPDKKTTFNKIRKATAREERGWNNNCCHGDTLTNSEQQRKKVTKQKQRTADGAVKVFPSDLESQKLELFH